MSDGRDRWVADAERGWDRVGDALVRELLFRDFDDALGFVGRLAESAVDYGRHPDVRIAAGRLLLSIANRHHAGLTLAELRLAAKVNAVVEEHYQEPIPEPFLGPRTS